MIEAQIVCYNWDKKQILLYLVVIMANWHSGMKIDGIID